MALADVFLEILKRPIVGVMVVKMVMSLVPLFIAFLLGLTLGWTWKPRWASLRNCQKLSFSAPSSPIKGPDLNQRKDACKLHAKDSVSEKEDISSLRTGKDDSCSSRPTREELVVTDGDLEYLCHLVERKDGGPPWRHTMVRSTPCMTYQAWQRDMETGPPQYCSRTVYEDATPEMLRDFFWDDEFRLKWDDMLIHAATVEECPITGTMTVHWVRKFPFFCSDREYTIGRRIWESGRSYYCVTKGVLCPSIPRHDKPRRVDLYYSSWYIQAVESRRGNGQLTACEVILFHYEDMGIPWEIAKYGVRQGMWGTVKKIERGFRAYQKERLSGAPLSRSAFMAQVNTRIDLDYLKYLEGDRESSETELLNSVRKPEVSFNIPKFLIFGGVVAIAFSLDRGLLSKALIFNVANRFAIIGRRSCPRT